MLSSCCWRIIVALISAIPGTATAGHPFSCGGIHTTTLFLKLPPFFEEHLDPYPRKSKGKQYYGDQENL